MKILYRQNAHKEKEKDIFALNGINNCYFKSIKQISQTDYGSKKRHSHTGFEFHIMISGEQHYESDGGRHELGAGRILAVPKGVPHSLIYADCPIEKFAFTFTVDDKKYACEGFSECVVFEASERIMSNARTASQLTANTPLKDILMENIVFETVCLLLNEIGLTVGLGEASNLGYEETESGDERVELAIQFIKDNVETPFQVKEVAAYCYLSEKQLNRLFLRDVGISVTEYIRRERLKRIEELLSSTRLSLTRISERFGFPTEHGFNIFFKKYNGMPPGEYRKMTNEGKM